LAAIVALYGILIALVIFAGSRAEGFYYDNVFIAQALLSDASELAIESHIGVLHDFDVLEQIQTHEILGSDPEIVEFLYGHLSDPARASLARSGGIDEIYGEEVYAVHLQERELAMASFDLAVAWSERAGTYSTLATILAVGLAFAAWASLMTQASAIRWIFALIATFVLVGSLGFLTVYVVSQEPIEGSISLNGHEGLVYTEGVECRSAEFVPSEAKRLRASPPTEYIPSEAEGLRASPLAEFVPKET
jgi:hypothetical protein